VKLKDIADLISGHISGKHVKDADVEITGVSGISDAKEGEITFLSGSKLLKELKESRASAVILKEAMPEIVMPQIIVRNPQYAFAVLLRHFYVKPHSHAGISEKAFISGKASVADNVTVYPFAYISDGVSIGAGAVIYPGVFIGENSAIGEGCVIHPNVTIREGVKIGKRAIIHAGAVIGSDGFGYVFEEAAHQKIPQVGDVVIEDDVEIGANVTIDRATTGSTIIARGTKIDNLVQIGHNVRVGKNSILVAQVGIGGSSNIGDGVILAGQVGISDHAVIEAGTTITAQSGVMPGEVKKGVYSGSPVFDHREWLRSMAVFAKLPELNKKIKNLEEEIKKMKEEAR
jgi:UDP-3-O-[3-hydroxymyristoyl] glucosamine N-acyltransferase